MVIESLFYFCIVCMFLIFLFKVGVGEEIGVYFLIKFIGFIIIFKLVFYILGEVFCSKSILM